MKTRRRNISGDRVTTPETSENSLPVPIDLIFEIFSRLTLKSIARCRCVSKLCASILRHPDFTELFLSRSLSRPKLLFACQKDHELFFFSAAQPQNVNENSSPVVVNYHMKFSFDRCYSIHSVVHGLFGLLDKRIISKGKTELEVMIGNPSTGQVLKLPTTSFKLRSLVGYDPIDKRFKVLSMTRLHVGRHFVADEHQVMTLGTENPTWRRIECCRLPYYPHIEICIDGILYYPSVDLSTKSFSIVCFDVKSEKFSFIGVKEPLERAVWDRRMINYNGKLSFYQPQGSFGIDRKCTSLKFWVLEDLGKQEWSEHEYLLPALWKDLVGYAGFRCVGVTRENEIVLSSFSPSHLFYLIYFNHERNTMVRVDIQGIEASKFDTRCTFLCHVENVKLM